jgi:hypothetical protein
MFLTMDSLSRKEWDLASHCLELILVRPDEEEEEWMPDPECLLMRCEVKSWSPHEPYLVGDDLHITVHLL